MKGYLVDGASLVGKITSGTTLTGSISSDISLRGKIAMAISIPDFDGDYEIEPTMEPIVLNTENRRMVSDIVIKGFTIPSDYGLITRVGDGIRVS